MFGIENPLGEHDVSMSSGMCDPLRIPLHGPMLECWPAHAAHSGGFSFEKSSWGANAAHGEACWPRDIALRAWCRDDSRLGMSLNHGSACEKRFCSGKYTWAEVLVKPHRAACVVPRRCAFVNPLGGQVLALCVLCPPSESEGQLKPLLTLSVVSIVVIVVVALLYMLNAFTRLRDPALDGLMSAHVSYFGTLFPSL